MRENESENKAKSLDTTQANKIIEHARKKILGPGLLKRIKEEHEKPNKYSGTTGIFFDPNWQDDFIRE